MIQNDGQSASKKIHCCTASYMTRTRQRHVLLYSVLRLMRDNNRKERMSAMALRMSHEMVTPRQYKKTTNRLRGWGVSQRVC